MEAVYAAKLAVLGTTILLLGGVMFGLIIYLDHPKRQQRWASITTRLLDWGVPILVAAIFATLYFKGPSP